VHDELKAPRSLGLIGDRPLTVGPTLTSYAPNVIEDATLAVSLEPAGGFAHRSADGPCAVHRQTHPDDAVSGRVKPAAGHSVSSSSPCKEGLSRSEDYPCVAYSRTPRRFSPASLPWRSPTASRFPLLRCRKDRHGRGAEMFPSKNIIQNAMHSQDHTTLVAAVKAAAAS